MVDSGLEIRALVLSKPTTEIILEKCGTEHGSSRLQGVVGNARSNLVLTLQNTSNAAHTLELAACFKA